MTHWALPTSDHPSTPPPVVPTGRFQGPRPSLLAASTAAPAARSCSTTAAWPRSAAQCSGVAPQAPKGSETSTALHPVALHRPPPHLSGRGSNLRSEVREFHLFKIVWQAGSMAATIVAGVCEDHQDYDYDLIIPSQAGKIRKATPNWLYA